MGETNPGKLASFTCGLSIITFVQQVHPPVSSAQDEFAALSNSLLCWSVFSLWAGDHKTFSSYSRLLRPVLYNSKSTLQRLNTAKAKAPLSQIPLKILNRQSKEVVEKISFPNDSELQWNEFITVTFYNEVGLRLWPSGRALFSTERPGNPKIFHCCSIANLNFLYLTLIKIIQDFDYYEWLFLFLILHQVHHCSFPKKVAASLCYFPPSENWMLYYFT